MSVTELLAIVAVVAGFCVMGWFIYLAGRGARRFVAAPTASLSTDALVAILLGAPGHSPVLRDLVVRLVDRRMARYDIPPDLVQRVYLIDAAYGEILGRLRRQDDQIASLRHLLGEHPTTTDMTAAIEEALADRATNDSVTAVRTDLEGRIARLERTVTRLRRRALADARPSLLWTLVGAVIGGLLGLWLNRGVSVSNHGLMFVHPLWHNGWIGLAVVVCGAALGAGISLLVQHFVGRRVTETEDEETVATTAAASGPNGAGQVTSLTTEQS